MVIAPDALEREALVALVERDRMKTAEEWSKELGFFEARRRISPKTVRQIQIDALRHAGRIMKHWGPVYAHGIGEVYMLADQLECQA